MTSADELFGVEDAWQNITRQITCQGANVEGIGMRAYHWPGVSSPANGGRD